MFVCFFFVLFVFFVVIATLGMGKKVRVTEKSNSYL